MKISFVLLTLSLGLSLGMRSAHAGDEAFYQSTAQSILDTIQSKANHLNTEEQAALDQLNSARDSQANIDTNPAAQNLLTKSFSALFVQADNIQLPIQTAEPIFGDSRRDLYTFCPTGSDVKRHLAQEPGLLDEAKTENVWGWSYCTSTTEAIRVQDLWVSNWKRPVLTLLIVGEEKKNLDIDLNQLVAGKVTEAQILKAITNSL